MTDHVQPERTASRRLPNADDNVASHSQ